MLILNHLFEKNYCNFSKKKKKTYSVVASLTFNGWKQKKGDTAHTQRVSVEKRTCGKRRERAEEGECSPWECSSITARPRPALSHCHTDATSTPSKRSPRTALFCFKHTHTGWCIHQSTDGHTPICWPQRWQVTAAATQTNKGPDMNTPAMCRTRGDLQQQQKDKGLMWTSCTSCECKQ